MGLPKIEPRFRLAALYIAVATPVAVGLAVGLWAPLLPVLGALAVYPPFFFYTRRGELGRAFLIAALWAAMHYSLLAGAAAMDIGHARQGGAGPFMASGGEEVTAAKYDDWRKVTLDAIMARAADLTAVAALSAVSGGALALAAGADGLDHLAVKAGMAMANGGGLDAAILSFPPWIMFRAAGLLMALAGVAHLFMLALERRPLAWGLAARWVGAGAFLLALDIYFFISLREPWARFLAEAMK